MPPISTFASYTIPGFLKRSQFWGKSRAFGIKSRDFRKMQSFGKIPTCKNGHEFLEKSPEVWKTP